MKIKLDENISPLSVNVFRANGFEATSVKDEGLTGCSDDHLISVCTDEDKILVTLDLDFSDMRRYHPSLFSGIIIIRTDKQSRDYINRILERIIPLLKTEDIRGKLVIVEENGIRIR